jgi:LmbE family N-acetylglucosaminyl deacetylase
MWWHVAAWLSHEISGEVMPHQRGSVPSVNRSLAFPSWARSAYQRRTGAKQATGLRVAAAPTSGSFVNIVAHSDDDLLFLNPDIQPSIASGLPVRTIVVSADEFNGVEGELTREEFAAQLREGARRAYASLADVDNDWETATLTVAERVVQVDTLVPAPQIQLITLNLPDGGDDRYPFALPRMWEDPDFVTPTIVPSASPVDEVQHYDGERLYLVLVELLNLFQPTTIRMQDPLPDPRRREENPDHVAVANFARLAVRTYEGPDATGLALLTCYRCYNTDLSPANVPGVLLGPKTAAYQEYNALDPITGTGFDINLARNYQRFPVTAPWVIRDGTGALHAVVVGADDVIAWRHSAGATTWVGPTSLISGSFAPGVAMAHNADGRVQLAVLDLDTAAIMTTRQTADGGEFDAWTSLGNPDDGLSGYGTPTLGVNSGGCLEMYVRNASGGLSNAFQSATNGDITGWFDVGGGPDILAQPVALTAPSGLLHVFADNNGDIAHWTQLHDGTSPDPDFPSIEAVATPSVVVDGTGKARLLTREHTDGAVGTSVESTPDGTWTGNSHINGDGGVGPVAAVLSGGADPRVLVFARNDRYGISMSRQAEGGTFSAWEDLGGYCEIGPAAAQDTAGLVRLLVVGADCRLYERRQSTVGPDGAFGAWQAVGGS